MKGMHLLATSCGLFLAACTAAEPMPAVAPAPSAAVAIHAGWYLQHAGQSRFQPCGQSQPLPIAERADLPARARAFGLDDDMPVYVRLRGTIARGQLRVVAVEQFGSSTPVRDCAMSGVVVPSP